MTNTSGGGFQIQGRQAADGNAGGPSMTPGRGPTNRTDVMIALGAVAAVIGAIVLLVTSG